MEAEPRKRIAPPRARQKRPTISFRTDRPVLERLDYLAQRFDITRNEVMQRVLKAYLIERGDDLEELMSRMEADRDQLNIFA